MSLVLTICENTDEYEGMDDDISLEYEHPGGRGLYLSNDANYNMNEQGIVCSFARDANNQILNELKALGDSIGIQVPVSTRLSKSKIITIQSSNLKLLTKKALAEEPNHNWKK
eukprot:13256441-Ditylum_brightwellii.AAC.1